MQQIQLDKPVKIEFTPDQIGYILNVLRKQTFEQVADLIPSIQQQILDQVQSKLPVNGQHDLTTVLQ